MFSITPTCKKRLIANISDSVDINVVGGGEEKEGKYFGETREKRQ